MTYTITNLPVFANHDDVAQNFDVPKTEDLNLHGVYDVTLRAEFAQPEDYTKATMIPIVNEYVFQIEMIDPCFASIMEHLIIDNMVRAVKQA